MNSEQITSWLTGILGPVGGWFPDWVSTALGAGLAALEKNFFAKLFGAFVPAFFLAGAMGAWISKDAVVKYLSPGSPRRIAYPFATVAGSMVSVCACGILPLFASIYARGAGIGPAVTFVVAGPAINLIACYYSFDLLGPALGLARIATVVVVAIATGLVFATWFGDPVREEPVVDCLAVDLGEDSGREGWQTAFPLVAMVVMTMALPGHYDGRLKLGIVAITLVATVVSTRRWFSAKERSEWMEKTRFLLGKIVPKVAIGIFFTGMLEPLVPREWVQAHVGDNGMAATLIAAMIGGCMYFGTVTGIVVSCFFRNMGMADGPLLAFVIAGPTVSLPSALAISGIIGPRRALVFFFLVVLGSAAGGWLYGNVLSAPMTRWLG